MNRQKFPTQSVLLRTETQRDLVLARVKHLPLYQDEPIEIVLRDPVKARGMDQNAAMWAGPLRDIASQAWVAGRQYCAETWHEQFKREYLPEDFDDELTKEGYRKWDVTPGGERVLIGSTTQLTKKGFSQYLTQIEAFGASLGVMFSAGRDERKAA